MDADRTGDIMLSIDPKRYTLPDYLPCDGGIYLRSSYPGLSASRPSWRGGAPKLLDLPGQTTLAAL
ncbi:hypothetical protein J4711_14005 [Staphylococcus epidermidis]|nr:hypothetical protein [Staphylococcus epidermidis]